MEQNLPGLTLLPPWVIVLFRGKVYKACSAVHIDHQCIGLQFTRCPLEPGDSGTGYHPGPGEYPNTNQYTFAHCDADAGTSSQGGIGRLGHLLW
jgi:hypothetical protein